MVKAVKSAPTNTQSVNTHTSEAEPQGTANEGTDGNEGGNDDGGDAETSILTNVIEIKGKGNRASLLDAVTVNVTASAAEKHAVMTTARQKLAEAFDLFEMGQDKAKEAEEVSNAAGVTLYQARLNGAVTMEEINAILGDQFGYKTRDKDADKSKAVPASDPKASKTPFGKGEAIRKRIVRACQAGEYLRDPDNASSYFENVPTDELERVLGAVDSGDLTLWTAYDRIAKIKNDNRDGPVEAAFNPKAIAKIMDQLAAEDAAERWIDNPTLVAAYAELRAMIGTVDHQAALLLQERQAA